MNQLFGRPADIVPRGYATPPKDPRILGVVDGVTITRRGINGNVEITLGMAFDSYHMHSWLLVNKLERRRKDIVFSPLALDPDIDSHEAEGVLQLAAEMDNLIKKVAGLKAEVEAVREVEDSSAVSDLIDEDEETVPAKMMG
ncbi:MAG: hypothetical protein Q9168_002709 [Polycauliona sp. 1 TL-2023]